MRFSSLFLLSLMPLLLAGCQSNTVKVAKMPDDKGAPAQQQIVSMTSPDGQDILSLSRGMSEGSVDIYEPGVAKLDVPAVEAFSPRKSPVPESNNVIVRDPSVTIFSLEADPVATSGATALTPMPFDAAPVSAPQPVPVAPAPRRYANELTPTNDRGVAMAQ